MAWQLTDDVDEFLDAAGSFMARDPVRHTIALTATGAARRRPAHQRSTDDLYGWWTDAHGRITGTVLHTPPFELLVEVVPDEAVPPLVDVLARDGRRPDGVIGPSATAAHVGALWAQRTGGRAELRVAQRLYRLGELAAPDPPPPGTTRQADEGDIELVDDWVTAFDAEAGTRTPDVAGWARTRVTERLVSLWLDDRRQPVAMAARSPVEAGMARVGPVYTPPEHRGSGYGGGATARASRGALDDGADHVVLFTDLTNATSNALYQRLGYRPVEDRLTLSVSPPGRDVATPLPV